MRTAKAVWLRVLCRKLPETALRRLHNDWISNLACFVANILFLSGNVAATKFVFSFYSTLLRDDTASLAKFNHAEFLVDICDTTFNPFTLKNPSGTTFTIALLQEPTRTTKLDDKSQMASQLST